MSRGRGRLRSVLRVREIAERSAQIELARGAAEAAHARARLADRRAAAAALSRPTAPLTPAQLRALDLQGLATHDLVVDAADEAEASEHRLSELRAAWSLASARRASVERLAERRAAEAADTARRAADVALDEAVLLRRAAAARRPR